MVFKLVVKYTMPKILYLSGGVVRVLQGGVSYLRTSLEGCHRSPHRMVSPSMVSHTQMIWLCTVIA